MFRKILGVFQNRWVLTGIGAAAVGLSIWLFGPALGVLGHFVPTTIALVLLTFAWGSANTLIDRAKRNNDAALASGVVGSSGRSAAADGEASKEEVTELRARLERALGLLRRTAGTRGYLYERPWYVIIGPPGAGKTTALENSGLTFPLEGELGHGEVRGVGGTALCEWIFTDQAILIDTAGRFVTQDSNAAVDRAGWEGFLDLLRRTRPQQPLNGVIVAVGLNEIVQSDDEERRAVARDVRARLRELTSKLGVRLPVYVVITKCDLLPGFTEFFGDYDRSQRSQVWGVTFPAQIDDVGPSRNLAPEFRALVAQISARFLDRLHDGRTLDSRSAITSFPAQLASIETTLAQFVEDAFSGTKLAPSVWLRGVYLTSATQTGTSIDRLTAQLAQSFGLDQKKLTFAGTQKGRSYFLERLLKDVIFGEAMLQTGGGDAGRRHQKIRLAAWIGAGALLALGLLWIAYSDWQGVRAIDRFNRSVADYQAAYSDFVNQGGSDRLVPAAASDLARVVPVLNQARAAAAARESRGVLGLVPAKEINKSKQTLYQNALDRLLRPRLLSLVEARIRSHVSDSIYEFAATRVYHMISGRDVPKAAAIQNWLANDLNATMEGQTLMSYRADLLAHTAALFGPHTGPPLTPIPEDLSLVAQSESSIGHVTIADQIVADLRSGAVPGGVSDFVPSKAAGALGVRYFRRKSGASLDVPVSGFFTPQGFHLMVEARIEAATNRAIAESAVRGAHDAIDPSDTARRQQIERDVIAAYTKLYIAAWNDLLGDIELSVPDNPAEALNADSYLTSPGGPIANLLREVANNLAVAQKPGANGAPADPTMSGSAIDDAFATLRVYITQGKLNLDLTALGQQMQAGTTPPTADFVNQFAQDPDPVGRWLTELANSGSRVRSNEAQQQAQTAYGAAGGAGDQCRQIVRLYPFNRFARSDAPIDQFSALFAPSGALDSYFTQYVRPYVSIVGNDWQAHDSGGVAPPISQSTVTSFKRAADIRDAFFGFGGSNPRISFNIRAVSFGPGTQSATLEIGGDSKTFTQQSPSQNYEWPGATGDETANIQFDSSTDGAPFHEQGSWALFRLIADGAPSAVPGNDRAVRLSYSLGGRQATFQLSAWPNAFRPGLLTGFSCPSL